MSFYTHLVDKGGTAIPQCHWQYWIRLKQNKEELIIPPFTEDEFTGILAVAQW